ncbi:MAG TPA: aldo/keto reductase [Vicinamibacteria bacterium]|nr:aldo/keto reductase [Vicinamibacteria bacterium]
MELRDCGRSGLRLPALGLGCWAFGGGEYWGRHEQPAVDAVVRRAYDLGVTYFDTAEVYNDGRSEASLGQALRGLPRERVVIGTKVSPAHVQADVLPRRCEASLERLGTDHVDLYMVHWPITPRSIVHFDPHATACPRVDDAFAALLRLREQGKVRYLGVSNFARSRLEEALLHCPDVVANELPYNLLSRAIEWEALPACRERGVGAIGYMALLQGVLTDRHATLDDVPAWQRRTRHFDARKTPSARHGQHGEEEAVGQALSGIRAVCREAAGTLPALALGWAVAKPGLACNLVGSRSVNDLEANVRAAERPLPAEVVARLDAITDRLKERLGPSFDYYESPENDRTR